MGLFSGKKYLLRSWDCLSILNWTGTHTVSIGKSASKNYMKFLSPDVALYLYKSTRWLCMEYCCHVWAGAPSCYLDILDKLQKQVCRTDGQTLAVSLEPLGHHRIVVSLSLFYMYYFGRILSSDL